MRFFVAATIFAVASAFTSQPNAFSSPRVEVGERSNGLVVDQSTAHRTRKATIVMDGKANGESLYVSSVFQYEGV